MSYDEQMDKPCLEKEALNIYLLKPHLQEKGCHRYGFCFEEILETFPEILVRDRETGAPVNVNYNDLLVLALMELKKHNEIIANQREAIRNLKDRLRIMEEQMAMILNKMAKE